MPANLLRLLVLAWLPCATAAAGTLVINANAADPTPRAAWSAAVERFRRENVGVEVQFNVYDHESYKKAIRNWLTSAPPDVVFWFAGERMRQFVTPGLLEDVTDLFPPAVRSSLHPSAVDLVSVAGRQYGVPYTYYQLGFFARRDTLANAGIHELPRTWNDLLAACDRLKANGVEPIAIGTRDLWPAAAWFDYLDLRLNGLAFHMDLMAGRIAYTDPRVRALFVPWRTLVERGCFSRSHASSSWQESQALIYQGKAAMMLIGNYIVGNFPPEQREQMAFFRFPTMREDVGRFEDAPMNTVHVPARARNKADAKRFLAFVLRADVQEALNRAMLQIPVNRQAAVVDDRFILQGRELLARADGLAQYFDRDTSEDLANVAMKGFQEFMLNPDRLDSILESIERARARIYGPPAPER
ncbi:MAG TPA: ABC transporter substrate-binding protein [Casimicrobiaceae bacterium]|nr:ABC transporter substrate-binding protein [Casimicrobiaceae bacterium]